MAAKFDHERSLTVSWPAKHNNQMRSWLWLIKFSIENKLFFGKFQASLSAINREINVVSQQTQN